MLRNTSCLCAFYGSDNMPPKNLFSRQEIVSAAVETVRKNGYTALTARSLAASLGCSSKPIFGAFENMDEVRDEVMSAAYNLYSEMMQRETESGNYPYYKATGMAYIRFAKEEKELFKLLFMRDRTGEKIDDKPDEEIVKAICNATGLSEKKACLFHLENWVYVHGIASMIATGYLDWDMELASSAVTDCYLGLKGRFSKTEE